MRRRRKRAGAIDVLRVLDELKLEPRKSGTELRGDCPHPDHEARPGPGSWQINPETGQHRCYSCGFAGGVVILVQTVLRIDHEGARKWLRERGGLSVEAKRINWKGKIEPKKVLHYPRGTIALWRTVPPEVQPALDYVHSRGLTDAQIERWRIGATPEYGQEYPARVIIPIVVQGVMVDFVARLWVERRKTIPKALSGRADRGARKELSLWGYDELDPAIGTVHVVEGIWGAVALINAGVRNVVAACGSAWSDERTALLAPWGTIYLVPDGDAAGAKLPERATSLRLSHRVFVISLPPGTQPDDHSPGVLRDLLEEAEPYRPRKTDPVRSFRFTSKAQ